MAQSLRRRQTHTIDIVTDAIASSPFAGRLFAGATERAAEHGYVLIAHDTHGHPEREPEAIATLMRRQVDGLVYPSMGFRHLPPAPDTPCPWSSPTALLAGTTSCASTPTTPVAPAPCRCVPGASPFHSDRHPRSRPIR